MKLRSRKSEYQQRFASPDKDYFRNVYEEQLAYRLKRREKENGHVFIQWDSESSEGSCDLSVNKLAVSEEASNVNPEVVERLTNATQSDVENTTSAVSPKTDYNKQLGSSDNKENATSCNKKPREQKVPPRDKSSERPPFLSYGWADEQVETGRKKTHNIHAPKRSVYPAALKRLKYLKLEKIKHKQKLEKRPNSTLPALFYEKPSDSSSWLTEYQRCYSSMSSRPNTAVSQRKREHKGKKGRAPR